MTLFTDDFEADRGWVRNLQGTDTATAGLFERGDPAATTSSGAKQLGTTVSGPTTSSPAGSRAPRRATTTSTAGSTTITSPPIALTGGRATRLSFSSYLAHGSNSSNADSLRIRVLGATTRGRLRAARGGDERQRRVGERDRVAERLRRPDGAAADRGDGRLHREPGGGGRRRPAGHPRVKREHGPPASLGDADGPGGTGVGAGATDQGSRVPRGRIRRRRLRLGRGRARAAAGGRLADVNSGIEGGFGCGGRIFGTGRVHFVPLSPDSAVRGDESPADVRNVPRAAGSTVAGGLKCAAAAASRLGSPPVPQRPLTFGQRPGATEPSAASAAADRSRPPRR